MGNITRIKRQCNKANSRSQWPRGLRRRSEAARLLRLWVRIPPVSWLSVSCECCQVVVSETGRSLIQGSLIDWCVVMCDQETS